MRRDQSAAFLWFIQFFCCAFLLLDASTSRAARVDAKTIERQLSNPAALGLNKTEAAELQKFYAQRGYQPVWLTDDPGPSLLESALTFIASADDEGLDSRDYGLPELQQLRQQADPSDAAAVALELRVTQAVLTLARDVSRGRLTATAADPDWHITQPDFDAAGFLQTAVQSDRLPQAFDELPPTKLHYRLLKQTLARYHKLAEAQVEWLKIPDAASIHPGDTHPHIPLIRQRIAQAYDADGIAGFQVKSSKSEHYDAELVSAVKAFQAQHNLNTDGVIGKNTLRALNRPLAWKIRQLRINMERLRWLPKKLGDRYLLVNTAGFMLTAAEQDQEVLSMRIIVGRDYRSTPTFNSAMSHMVLNPYWNVPHSIATKDLLPKQKSDPAFFSNGGFKIFPGNNRNAEPIDPDAIDWHDLKGGFPYFLRQDPGKQNALGRIKFMFPNSFSIYLHDTPSKSLFQRDIRTFSSGCIRLEKPMELAAFALKEQSLPEKFMADLDSENTKTVHLPKPLPIFLVYITAWVDEHEMVHFSPDIYDRDLRALRYARW